MIRALLWLALAPPARAGMVARPHPTAHGSLALALHAMGADPSPAWAPQQAAVDALLGSIHLGTREEDVAPAVFDRPDSPNRAILDPLLIAMTLGGDLSPEGLAAARESARALPPEAFTPEAVGRALALAPAVVRAWVRDSRQELAEISGANYAQAEDYLSAVSRQERAALAAWLRFAPYLGPEESELRSLWRDWSRKEKSARDAWGARKAGEAERAVEEGTRGWSPDAPGQGEGGLMDLPPVEGAAWDNTDGYDGFLAEGNGKYSGYTDLSEEEREAHRLRNRAEEEGEAPRESAYRYRLRAFSRIAPGREFDPESPEFPLDAVRGVHFDAMLEAAQAGRARRFWKIARRASRDFEAYAKAYATLFSRIDALSPAVRAHLDRLLEQNKRLFDEIHAMAAEHRLKTRYGWFGRDDPRLAKDRVAAAFADLRSALKDKEYWLEHGVENAYYRLGRSPNPSRGAERVNDLLILDRYYRERLRAAQADPDPGHGRDFLDDVRRGTMRGGPILPDADGEMKRTWIEVLPPLARAIRLYNRAIRDGDAAFLPAREFLAAAAAPAAWILLWGALGIWAPAALAVLAPLVWVTAAAMLAWIVWVTARSAYRSWRIRRMGALLERLARAATPRADS